MGKLRPSLSSVWLNCPKAPALCEQVPQLENEFTLRGTQMHLCAAYAVRDAFEIPQIPMTFKCDNPSEIIKYADFCKRLVSDYFHSDSYEAIVEQKVPLSDFLYDGNGIIDFAAYNPHRVLVIDYKSGTQLVPAKDNSQLNIYAAALIIKLRKQGYDPQEIYLAICQPLLDNYSVVYFNVEDLIGWLDSKRKNIDNAYKNLGNYTPGKHCNHCNGRAVCKAYLLHTLNKGGSENGTESEND